MRSTVETAHAEHGGDMRSQCDEDSECEAHAMETAHAEHMRWRQRMRSTVETSHAEQI